MSKREAFESWATAPVQIGELAAIGKDGMTPLVVSPMDPEGAARAARSVVDLHAGHIGRQVVLLFENADPRKPIVMGVLGDQAAPAPSSLTVEANGDRILVSARRQLVLRCGDASITLTSAGKVLIEGAYVSSKSAGVNRIKGGSVQLN
jgi:hypothetical protein